MRRLPAALAPAGPSLVLAVVLIVLALGSGGVLIANEIAARDGERSSFLVEEGQGERFEDVVRVRSDDNAGTSVAFSQLAFPEDGSARTVVIGRDDVFADNLAAGLLQSRGPLLLTDPQRLNATVRDEIRRLGAQSVYIVGGTKAVAPAVEAELRDLGLATTRLSGPTRIETAVAIARAMPPVSAQALIVRARDAAGKDSSQAWADSLAAGSYAASAGVPVLLTTTETLHPAVESWLISAKIQRVYAVGGRAAVGSGVLDAVEAMGAKTLRISGAERTETAIAVAQQLWGFSGSKTAGRIILVDGFANDSWAAGVVAASYSARFQAPLVLANGTKIPPATERWITQGGGTLVCSASVQDSACESAAASAPDQSGGQSPTPTPTSSAHPTGPPSPAPTEPPDLVRLSNSQPGVALFRVKLLPGNTETRRITIQNSGTVAVDVRLFGETVGNLANVLTMTVVADPDGTPETVYSGTMRNFATTHTNYATGTASKRLTRNDTRTFEFAVSWPSSQPYSADTATAKFIWEGRTG